MREAIFEMYQHLQIGRNEICQDCRKVDDLEFPNSIYYIGEKFHSSEDTIFFVGKTAVSEAPSNEKNDLFIDAMEFGEDSLDLREPKSKQRKFYSYTHEIIERYYGDYNAGKQYVALSNLMKCNNGSTKDTTKTGVKVQCLDNLKVIWREVEILKPKRIIFYTGRNYDNFIDRFNPLGSFKSDHIEKNEKDCWWHKRFYAQDMTIMCDILRVYHPDAFTYIGEQEGEEYITKVVAWLNQTKGQTTRTISEQ
jgi:hypothetical protein